MMSAIVQPAPAECNLFGLAGFVVQGVLGVISFFSLVGEDYAGKRYLEKQPRPWRVWAMDTSKQALSAGVIHLVNMAASYQIDQSTKDSNQCVWYFLNLVMDNLFGMGLCYLLLKTAEHLFALSRWLHFVSGDYGTPPSLRQWAFQLYVWLTICVVMKCTVLWVIWMFEVELAYVGKLLLAPLSIDPVLELVFVMIIIPVLLNCLMFWVTDSFLQVPAPASQLSEPLVMPAK